MDEVQLRHLKTHVVDARGGACPGPLLETKKALTGVPVGDILETLSSDEGTKADIPVWARKTGQEYLGTVTDSGYDHIYVRRLK